MKAASTVAALDTVAAAVAVQTGEKATHIVLTYTFEEAANILALRVNAAANATYVDSIVITFGAAAE